jgi:hypothetical protein
VEDEDEDHKEEHEDHEGDSSRRMALTVMARMMIPPTRCVQPDLANSPSLTAFLWEPLGSSADDNGNGGSKKTAAVVAVAAMVVNRILVREIDIARVEVFARWGALMKRMGRVRRKTKRRRNAS